MKHVFLLCVAGLLSLLTNISQAQTGTIWTSRTSAANNIWNSVTYTAGGGAAFTNKTTTSRSDHSGVVEACRSVYPNAPTRSSELAPV